MPISSRATRQCAATCQKRGAQENTPPHLRFHHESARSNCGRALIKKSRTTLCVLSLLLRNKWPNTGISPRSGILFSPCLCAFCTKPPNNRLWPASKVACVEISEFLICGNPSRLPSTGLSCLPSLLLSVNMICCCSFSFSIRRGVTRSSEPVTSDSSLTAFSACSLVYKVILLSSTACILFSVPTEGRDRIFALKFCCSALSRTRKLGVSLNIVLNMPMPSFFAGLLLKLTEPKRPRFAAEDQSTPSSLKLDASTSIIATDISI